MDKKIAKPPVTLHCQLLSMSSFADDDMDMDMDMDLGDNDEGFDESKSNNEEVVAMDVEPTTNLPPAPFPQGKHKIVVEIDRSRVRTGGQYANPKTDRTKKSIIAAPTDVKKSDFATSLVAAGAADVLSNSEVAILLSKYGDPNTSGAEVQKQSTSVFDQTFEYVERFSSTKHPTKKIEYVVALRKDLEALRFTGDEEVEHKIEPFEIAALCNLNLQEPNQIKELIPSLRRLDDEQLNTILDAIGKSAARRE